MKTAYNQTIPVSDEFKKVYIRRMNQQSPITNITINEEDNKITIALETGSSETKVTYKACLSLSVLCTPHVPMTYLG